MVLTLCGNRYSSVLPGTQFTSGVSLTFGSSILQPRTLSTDTSLRFIYLYFLLDLWHFFPRNLIRLYTSFFLNSRVQILILIITRRSQVAIVKQFVLSFLNETFIIYSNPKTYILIKHINITLRFWKNKIDFTMMFFFYHFIHYWVVESLHCWHIIFLNIDDCTEIERCLKHWIKMYLVFDLRSKTKIRIVFKCFK